MCLWIGLPARTGLWWRKLRSFLNSFCRLSLGDCSMSGFRLFLEIQETLKIQTQCGTGIVYLQTSKSEAILQDGDAVLGALNDNRRFSVAGRSQEMLACCLPMLKMEATCARLTAWLCLIGMMIEMFFWSCQTWDADIWCASSFAQWSGYVLVLGCFHPLRHLPLWRIVFWVRWVNFNGSPTLGRIYEYVYIIWCIHYIVYTYLIGVPVSNEVANNP